jgi:hypothetical protein
MAQNFIACDREQELLLPPSPREWLPEDHLAWFVLDAVEAFDLMPFLVGYRLDGWGRAGHDPAMMVALCCSTRTRSASGPRGGSSGALTTTSRSASSSPTRRRITTIAQFRQRHEAALGELFGEGASRCAARRGSSRLGVIAIDATKVHANASQHAKPRLRAIRAREILAEAAEVDRLEDEQFGEARGDKLPPELSTAQGRRGWLREAKRRLGDRRAEEARPIPACAGRIRKPDPHGRPFLAFAKHATRCHLAPAGP